MKEHPILFSGEMVRAILEGRKTQTRRVVMVPVSDAHAGRPHPPMVKHNGDWYKPHEWSPSGVPGDRLWVRETWRVGAWNVDDQSIAVDYRADGYCRREWLTVEDDELWERLWYQSSDDARAAKMPMDEEGNYKWEPGQSPCRWRPSIFMPRWASRITLDVVNIRVERVQDISEEDARAEGIDDGWLVREQFPEARIAYKYLWDSINAKRGYGWDVNPWVWVIEFK